MYEYKAKITKVVDGDTVYAVIDLGMSITVKKKIRLARLDTPELRTEAGKDAKTFLRELVEKFPELVIRTTLDKGDKYGRLLGEFFNPEGSSLNQMLLDGGWAKVYE